MKIRDCFVSNSSSSSFAIYGACLSWSEIKAKLSKGHDVVEEPSDEDGYDDRDDYKDRDDFNETAGRLGLVVHSLDYCDDEIFVGREWSVIDDAETGAQFKERTQNDIERLVGKSVACCAHSGEYQC